MGFVSAISDTNLQDDEAAEHHDKHKGTIFFVTCTRLLDSLTKVTIRYTTQFTISRTP